MDPTLLLFFTVLAVLISGVMTSSTAGDVFRIEKVNKAVGKPRAFLDVYTSSVT